MKGAGERRVSAYSPSTSTTQSPLVDARTTKERMQENDEWLLFLIFVQKTNWVSCCCTFSFSIWNGNGFGLSTETTDSTDASTDLRQSVIVVRASARSHAKVEERDWRTRGPVPLPFTVILNIRITQKTKTGRLLFFTNLFQLVRSWSHFHLNLNTKWNRFN